MYTYSKDGVTMRSILDTRRPVKSGLYPVKTMVCYQRLQKYYNTGKTLSEEEWRKLPTTKSASLIAIRQNIENSFAIIRDIVETLTNIGSFSFMTLESRIGNASSGTLNDIFQAKIQKLIADGCVGNSTIYITALHSIESFAGDKIPLFTVTVDWLKKYEKYLYKKGLSLNTMGIYFRTIRAIINIAKRSGMIKESQYPFGRDGFIIQNGPGHKRALTLDQIKQILKYDDGSLVTTRFRDIWIFIYLCNGINVADLIHLKFKDIIDGEICFIRQKTSRTAKTQEKIRAVVTDKMQEIIDRWGNIPKPENYIFPVLNNKNDSNPEVVYKKKNFFTGAINKRMKKIGNDLGIGNITTYVARHSFATVLKRSGANIAYISDCLGHHNNITVTENYLAEFEKEERIKNAALLL